MDGVMDTGWLLRGRWAAIAAAFALVLAPVLWVGPAAVAAPAPAGDGFARIDAYARSAMEASAIPGLAYGIVRDGEIVHLAAFGTADSSGRPMTPQVPLVIGSTGKTITALAIRQLVEAGRIDPGAPVTRYLPWFATATSGAAASITIDSLLRHTSGISTADGQDPRFYEPGLTPEAVVRALRDVPLDRPVGTYEYSNLNYVILGVVVEAVSGQGYEEYLRDHVFGPLGMAHSYGSLAAARADGLAEGHRYLFGQPVGFDEPYPTGMVPAGYQVSTAEDMARYAAAMSNHGRLGGLDIVGAAAGAGDRDYGVDWIPLESPPPGFTPGHSGTTLGTNTAIMYTPGSHVGVVVLANANPTQLLGLPIGVSDLALDMLRLESGGAPAAGGLTVRTLYLVVDVILVALAALVAAELVWLARERRARRAIAHPRRRAAAVLAGNVLLPLAILVGLPVAIGMSGSTRPLDLPGAWRFVLWTLPDLGVALLVTGLALAAIGLVEALAWRRGAIHRPAMTPVVPHAGSGSSPG